MNLGFFSFLFLDEGSVGNIPYPVN